MNRKYYPLTHAQKRIWFDEKTYLNTPFANLAFTVKFRRDISLELIQKAVNLLLAKNDGLRLQFVELNDGNRIGPSQYIANYEEIKLDRFDFSGSHSKELPRWINRETRQPFNLIGNPLFYFAVLRLPSGETGLYVNLHHLIADDWSINLLLNDLSNYIDELEKGIEIDLEKRPSYVECISDEASYIKSSQFRKDRDFWIGEFSPLPEKNDISVKAKATNIEANRLIFTVPSVLRTKMLDYCKSNNTSLFELFLSALSICISRLSMNPDVVIRTVNHNRVTPNQKSMAGMFVADIPFRTDLSVDEDFSTFVTNIGKDIDYILKNHSAYPFDALIDDLTEINGRLPDNLFSVAFADHSDDSPKNMSVDWHFTGYNPMPLTIHLNQRGDDGKGTSRLYVEFQIELFSVDEVKSIVTCLFNVLEDGISNPKKKTNQIQPISASQKQKLLYDFNDTQADFPEDRTIFELFESQTEKAPDNLAVICGSKQLSYKELNEKANQLARHLRGQGVVADSIVGIMMERSPEIIIGMFGILKAGGAYLPIDPTYPAKRIEHMLEESDAKILLSQDNLRKKASFEGEFIDLRDDGLYSGDDTNLERISGPGNLAVIIYTSGSTGKPKGVMLEHRSIVNFVNWHKEEFDISEGKNCAEHPSFSFDYSICETFSPLLSGATLHIICDDIRLSPIELNDYFEEHDITYSGLPTQFCEQFMELADNKSLKRVIAGGDTLQAFVKCNYRLVNAYGPTECTVLTTFFPVEKNYERYPIGKPIANVRVYILDKNNNLQPVGVPGELCIAGAGLARGYLNRPDLTAEKFVPDPFSPSGRMYKTGDLARWLPDGNLDFIGRMDRQVKIRGFRIELGEIEIQLKNQPGVKEAVVLDRKDDEGGRYLCAYVVAKAGLHLEELKASLSKVLPNYMIPSYFILLDAIPLTPTGKLNRRLLPEPAQIRRGVSLEGPRNETEECVARAFEKVLGLELVGTHENFFDLGGHSLRAVTLVAELQKEFKISVNDIFDHPTVAQLAKSISPLKDNLRVRLNKLKDTQSSTYALKDSSYLDDPAIRSDLLTYRKNNERYLDMNISDRVDYRNILLTGATGYLGIYLLRGLLEKEKCDIHLVVRGDTLEAATQRLVEKMRYYFGEGCYEKYRDRLFIYKGDLSKESLGLRTETYDLLTRKVDCIIHSAADVKHYGHYREFYDSNVKATENLIKFATMNRKKDFNHISTMSVATGNVSGKSRVVFTEDESYIGQEVDNYYIKTKLESENIVIAARKGGLTTNIFRAGNITFDSDRGHLQQNIEENGFYTIIKSYIHLGIVPETGDEVEFSFVDKTADIVLLLFNRDRLTNGTYHIHNTHIVKLSDILSSTELSLDIKRLPFRQFIDYLYDNIETAGLRSYVENILLHKGWLFDKKEQTEFVVLSERTQMILEKLGYEWPDLRLKTMSNMIDHARRANRSSQNKKASA